MINSDHQKMGKSSLVENLTWREMDILELVSDRLSDQEIAIKLSLSISTVKWHVRQILGKLGVSNRRQAVVCAKDLGLLIGQKNIPSMPLDRPLKRGVAEPPLKNSHLFPNPNNLPVQPTPFIGRGNEVAQARDLVLQDGVRLITITGVGGSGKTRLALQVCADLIGEPHFQDGVFFVSLASIRDPGLVILTISKIVGAKETAGLSIMEFVIEALRHKQLLLLLDNFEQVISAAPLIGELLSSCSGLRIIVTSREPLHLRGEREFPIPPLPLPDLQNLPKLQSLSKYTAIELFMHWAISVKPSFSLTDDNARAIAEICARVDGLPLGIELAAARVKFFPPQVILKHLEHRLAFLTGGARDLPGRHQTLRNTIDWSYELLSENEKIFLNRMSLFVGGCTLEALEGICNSDRVLKDEPLNILASLIDQNLLRQDDIGAEPRFGMLEVIREYGLEHLTSAGELEVMRELHANFYLALAEQADLMIETPEQALWLDRLQLEYDNLRSALDWFADSTSAEGGLRMGIALWRFWELRGYLTEGRERLAQMLSLSETKALTKLRMKALYAAGVLAYAQCDYETAQSLFEENLGISRDVGKSLTVVAALNNLGNIYDIRGDYQRSQSSYTEALDISRELGDALGIAWGLKSLANLANRQGDYVAARKLYEEALEMWKKVGSSGSIAAGFNDLGNVASAQGDYAAAGSAYTSSLKIFQEVGHKGGAAIALNNLGNVASVQGDYHAAHGFYVKSLEATQTLGDKRGIARLLENFADLAARQGQPERAVRLVGAAAVLRIAVSAPLSPLMSNKVQHTLDLARKALPPKEVAEKWDEGQAMAMDEATAYAIANDISR
jgi:predicted ATPase/DNA-binding CsgD family transcriptional regulator/Tfp pilus assembly protein PilF